MKLGTLTYNYTVSCSFPISSCAALHQAFHIGTAIAALDQRVRNRSTRLLDTTQRMPRDRAPPCPYKSGAQHAPGPNRQRASEFLGWSSSEVGWSVTRFSRSVKITFNFYYGKLRLGTEAGVAEEPDINRRRLCHHRSKRSYRHGHQTS